MDFQQFGATPLEGRMWVDGSWFEHAGSHAIEVDNPASEALLGQVPAGDAAAVDAAVAAATRAQSDWARRPANERGKLLTRWAEEIDRHLEPFARLIALEQGKPLSQARGEVGACSEFLRYSAQWARRIEGDILPSDNRHEEIQIRSLPLGVVAGLAAWNYPAALATRKAGPALVAGNTFILLGHEITPFAGLYLAALSERAGFPPGVFNVVTGQGPVVGQALVEHPDTDLITMTGSTRAGRQIFRSAAEELKIVRLELGGKAPFIVMEDADVDAAVKAAVTARYTNCGQICTCSERIYLHRQIADEFIDKFIAASRALSIGNPLDDPDMGPKVSRGERDKVAAMVQRGIAQGDSVLLEGGPLDSGDYAKGYWIAPTIVETRDNRSPLIDDEVFGPVVPIQRVDDFEQALAFANDTSYGLSAYVFTRDLKRLMRLPSELRFGEIYFNRANGEQVHAYHSGWGHSGVGGEDGKYGFSAYFKKQTMYVNWGD
ncbi:aldehyde dehydrogenase family protein [Halomonas sp. EF61]|uniref:aldehyde dehydrogenase family protein n=1 Tax=Halomonas sp. EF61 TaxID=2950869 RepID=UPI0032DFAC15